jgi:DNA-binding MarR family transcriptional regulator
MPEPIGIIGLTIISIVIKFGLMNENLGTVLVDVARHLRRSFDVRARDIGVTRPQWQVLTMLRRHEGVNQGKLADLLEVEPITVCRMVDRLQDADLVERRPDPADRRAWCLFLTVKAQGVIDSLRPLAESVFEEAFEGVAAEERNNMVATLERIRLNLLRRPVEPMVTHG